MRKVSQYWIEDPLRAVSQPVQFTIDGRVDVSTGSQFVRSARLLNSNNLPVFSYKTRVNGIEFSYSRIFDREYVGIYSPVVGGGSVTVEEIVKTVLSRPVVTFMLYDVGSKYSYGHYICRDMDFSLNGYVQGFSIAGVVESVDYSNRVPEELRVTELDNIGDDLLVVTGEGGIPGVYTPPHTEHYYIGDTFPPDIPPAT